MTKTQRELLILGGILAVIVVIIVLRMGGGDETPVVPVTNVPPAGQRVTPGTDNLQGLDITQAPVEMLNPMLTDSAVTARIAAGTIRDPFASDRRISTRTPSRTPRQTDPVRSEPTLREVYLESWPDGVTFQGLLPRIDAPGEYAVQFNGEPVRTGETIAGTRWNNIAGTEWVLREASRLVIVIRREVKTSTRWEITWYRHVRMQSMEADR
ncbi:hypothetical protein ACFL6T_05770 [Candidatus Zixiibacteriota bacterium]